MSKSQTHGNPEVQAPRSMDRGLLMLVAGPARVSIGGSGVVGRGYWHVGPWALVGGLK